MWAFCLDCHCFIHLCVANERRRGENRENRKDHDYHRSEYEMVFMLRSWRFGQINHYAIMYAIIPLKDAVGKNGDRLLTLARNNGACTRLRNESNALILLRGKHLFLLISLVILVVIIVRFSVLQNCSTAFEERSAEENVKNCFAILFLYFNRFRTLTPCFVHFSSTINFIDQYHNTFRNHNSEFEMNVC